MSESWLTVRHNDAPLIVSLPHAGLELPSDCAAGLVSVDLARRDADWYVDQLYSFADDFGATIYEPPCREQSLTSIDASGASLYPGQATTGLVPTETFDGRQLYRDGAAPTPQEVECRKQLYFAPYHAALAHGTPARPA